MKAADVRRTFLEFFKSQGHEVVDSSSLVPANDPTLLFTNAGMNQFKDVFTGAETARLQARDVLAEVRARRRQAQRPRRGRQDAAPPHVLRDARQLLVRRLLQGRRDRVRLGAARRRSTASTRAHGRHRLRRRHGAAGHRGRRRGARDLEAGHRLRRRPRHRPRREGQLLADGRHRPDGAVHRDPLQLRRERHVADHRIRRAGRAGSRSGTSCSCSSSGARAAASCSSCRRRRSTPARASSA